MPASARVPRRLSFLPFRGSAAVSDGQLTWAMLRGPAWRRLLPDVYVHRDGYRLDDHRMWCDAVALRLPPGSAIAGRSAAYLWGADLLARDAPVTVLLPRAARVRPHPRVHVIRSVLPDADRTRFAGLPVTTALRTTFDLGRQGPRTDALIAVEALLHRRVVKLPLLRVFAAARPGWPGMPLLREVLALAEPLSESPMETRLRLLLLDAGLGPLTAQHDVLDARGRFVGRVDLAWPALRVAVEYDGDHHRKRAHFRQDVARLNALRAAGWLVLRFTADDVLRRPAHTVALVAQALRERGATLVAR
ncbi:endonuclease domain-containing protein [Micromonospora sp. NPDC007230]|uniref:endonuclease domain-containing protein n=1 Tax=Micromonospora sp. NPDC007230 TaxID=3364237 RepID=UPI0036CBE59C